MKKNLKTLSTLLVIAGITPLSIARDVSPAAPTGPITAENTAEALATPVEKRTEEQKALVYAKIQADNRASAEQRRLKSVREMATVRSEKVDLSQILDGNLTDADGKPVAIDTIKKARYVVFYHSSSWCCGCKTYTPLLMEAAKKYDPSNVAIVFVSWDKPGEDTQKYMKKSGFAWPSVHRSALANSPAGLAIQGIPHLRVYDAAGSFIMGSLDDKGNITGQANQIDALNKLVADPE